MAPMTTGDDALTETNWPALLHAYGRAIDTPGHLRALRGDDDAARGPAMTHLWSAIIHQGTPWMATAPVARVLAGWLSSGRIHRDDPLRPKLLSFLASVAEAGHGATDESDATLEREVDAHLAAGEDEEIYSDDDLATALFHRDQRACRDTMPVVLRCFTDELSHPSPVVRANAAAGAATVFGRGGGPEAEELARRLRALADQARGTDERCAHVLALGDLGVDTSGFLGDPSPAVRICAALAPGLADAPAAIDELVAALRRAAELESWFAERPPQFPMSPRFAVITQLVRRAPSFDRIVDGAIAVLPLTTPWVQLDVKPLLLKAFPARDGKIRTEAQRRFLQAMVDEDKIWDPTNGTAALMFADAGLPFDRKACRQLCAGASA